MIKILLNSTLVLLILFSGCVSKDSKTVSNEKPNIIFIFSDDQCYSTIHALGNNEIRTPSLDKLAREGVTFTHAYNMGAWHGAVCVASRLMLNTGRFIWRAHAVENSQQDLLERGEMWGQLMQKAGYDTYMSGKWHVRSKAEDHFEQVVHVRPGMPGDAWDRDVFLKLQELEKEGATDLSEAFPVGYHRPEGPDDKSWTPWDTTFGGFWEGGKHWSEVLGDDALSFIDSAKNRNNPFFMYLAFNAPHDPRQAPKEFVDMYPLEQVSVPESYIDEYPYKDEIGCGPSLRDEALAPFPRTEYAVQVNRQEYYAIISHMDQQIGRILEAIEKSGKADNTYIFFTSDHGLAVGNHGLMGKQNMYDHSIRVPLFVVGPDVPKNKRKDVDVYLQDVMASALELAGVDKPEYVEFNSLMPFVRGERHESYYPAIYGSYTKDRQRMVRADGFKLIVYPHAKTFRLYDLENDPFELNDLAGDPDYSEIQTKLYNKLLQMQKEMDDPLDLAMFFP